MAANPIDRQKLAVGKTFGIGSRRRRYSTDPARAGSYAIRRAKRFQRRYSG